MMMKLQIFIVLLIIPIHICTMVFEQENPHESLVKRKSNQDHVVIDLPLKECGICYEDKNLIGSVPCIEGDKHPEVCDHCLHQLYKEGHPCTGKCPFCKRDLLISDDFSCSICREKLQNIDTIEHCLKKASCFFCFVAVYKAIRSNFD